MTPHAAGPMNRTLYRMFLETVAAYGDRPALSFRCGKAADYTCWSYTELGSRVRGFAAGLHALGLRRGERIALLSDNRAEWAVADLAAQALGLVTVAPYATLPAAQVADILADSGARLLILSDAKQRAKLAEVRRCVASLQHVVGIDGEPAQLESEGILPFDEVSRRGADVTCDELDSVIAAVHPGDVATFIYTSGTTGEPKGAMLTHTNILQTPDAVVDEPVADLGCEDVFLSFLPLSHITERVAGYYLPLRLGAHIVYSQGLMALAEEMGAVRPTCMLCVPRLFEAMRAKALDRIAKLDARKRRIALWAIAIGEASAHRRSQGRTVGPVLGVQRMLAERLVLAKIRTVLTGGRNRYFVSGGAPLDSRTAAFFLGLGVQILEGYGLSETNIIAVNRPGRQRIGTVGTLLQHVDLRIAADGEILMRGQGRMAGYHGKPQATADAIDCEGWFHTGDIGELSKDGYLKITDRKKDLIVLANGKKVAPQPIEAELKQSPYIAEAVLTGDRQSTVGALLVPAFDKLLTWAKGQGLAVEDVPVLLERPEVYKLYRGEIDAATRGLADYEKVKRFKLVPRPFGIDTGELTPTLKVKRKVVAEKYADVIASLGRQ